ncbi:hypothetical protein ACWEO2_07920 [Nocardia sp. NPDC004278]
MKARNFVGAAVAVATVSLASGGVASAADLDPAPYLVGDTVYFSYGNMASCAMHPNGDVGCDIQPGTARWFGILPVTDLAIDLPFLPAHPTFGQHGMAGSPGLALDPSTSTNPYPGNATISYGGATCVGSGARAELSCRSKGHSFAFGFGGTQVS